MSLSINKIFLLVFAIFISIYALKALNLGKTVYGDGNYYYSWVRSIVVDHDISFTNEYAKLGGVQPTSPTGATGNVYPIGPALFWFPFFALIHTIIQGDGYSFGYQFFIGLISCLYALTGLIILYRLLTKFFSDQISLFATLGIAFGTNLFFYGSFDTVNSHSLSFFISTVLLSFILEKRSLFLIGFFTGLLALMRTQDAIFILLVIPFLLEKIKSGRFFSSFFLLASSFSLAFLPQLIAWQLLYGSFLKSPYLDPYHYFDFFHPHLLEVFLSPNNGLFLWTPIIAFSIIGLFYKGKIFGLQKSTFIVLLIIQWFLIASWSFWWQGASFSGRMFISLLPVFAFGLGNILNRFYRPTQIMFILVFSLMNFGAILFYLISH